ncbi:aldolase catalytic domain-containing protein [Clostridium aestuarii]|uniref:Aldolase catalytic domain-containing protein n=1 Tax=Clostridium aestuarii TaxID=338193 RepID=A0ABT4CXT7_9CLOT|nr:aldolase catalytic domain-containing protein [Clostridium aestuarii]MCY6483672.1 aldolase catalytic domain-containing protein [Clostridium aestuarii]
MNNIEILDSTLRDGGYVNNWRFNSYTASKIVKSLNQANIDIVELGYVNDTKGASIDSTLFSNIEDIKKILYTNNTSRYVVMINYGDVNIEKVQYNQEIFGIRLAFHKKNWKKALIDAKNLIELGYNVLIQPMLTINYSDIELLQLINECNKLNIYAFYIVDSFGSMRQEEVLRLAYLIDNNLNKEVRIGLHCHNNLQLAYSNSIKFIESIYNRNLIVDTSVLGMGRGAGNLNTELFADYLIRVCGKNYKIQPLLDIIDSNLSIIYRDNYWGYSVGHYISAIYNCHPNYATYLVEKKTLSINKIEQIVKAIKDEKRANYDKKYIENLYTKYNSQTDTVKSMIKNLENYIKDNEVLLIAPGKSLLDYKEKIKSFMNSRNLIGISVNHISDIVNTDFYFFSNEKRYNEYINQINQLKIDNKIITTSNLKDFNSILVNYKELLGITHEAKDNSSIMLLNLLNKLKVKKVYIAGIDGYDYSENSYISNNMELAYSKERVKNLNKDIKLELFNIKNNLEIEFITPSRFDLPTYMKEVAVD